MLASLGGPTLCNYRLLDSIKRYNGLAGIIDSLGGIVEDTTKFFGHTDGRMSTYEYFSGLEDASTITSQDLGVAFVHIIKTKIITLPLYEHYINLISFPFIPYSTGTLSLYYAKDDGSKNWALVKTLTVTTAMLGIGQLLQIKRAIKAKRIIFKIQSENCMLAHNGMDVRIIKSGVSKNGSGI